MNIHQRLKEVDFLEILISPDVLCWDGVWCNSWSIIFSDNMATSPIMILLCSSNCIVKSACWAQMGMQYRRICEGLDCY